MGRAAWTPAYAAQRAPRINPLTARRQAAYSIGMENIARLLDLHRAEEHWGRSGGLVVTIIGSGGKTTLLWTLAQSFRHEKVLACTTVKMICPEKSRYDHLLEVELPVPPLEPAAGITFAGKHINEKGKTGSFSLEFLGHLFPVFDKAFIEGDGSRNLPFKGWAAHEPVVPDSTGLTVAVMPVPPEGARVTDEFVHRIPIFCGLTGAEPGDEITLEHLAACISHPEGPLRSARGRVALFFNQAEEPEKLEKAGRIMKLLTPECRERFWMILAGSARRNTGLRLG